MKSLCSRNILKKINGTFIPGSLPLNQLYVAYNNADWIWNNKNMNPVPLQSYADSKHIHKHPPPPPSSSKHVQSPISTAKNILVKIEKDFSTKIWGKVTAFNLNCFADN